MRRLLSCARRRRAQITSQANHQAKSMSRNIPYRPLWMKLLNTVGAVFDRVGIRPRLDANDILQRVRKKTGLQGPAPGWDQGGLEMLVWSLNNESQLNTFGRIATRQMLVGLVSNYVTLNDWFDKHPEEEQQVIEKPVFIVGLPRTGTSAMHGLMATDPLSRSPLFWEVNTPLPRPHPDHIDDDPRIAEMQKQIDMQYEMAPGFQAIHKMDATMPQEDSASMQQAMYGITLTLMWYVPTYRKWLMEADPEPALQFHKRFLQMLQATEPDNRPIERWLLKTPDHLGSLAAIFKLFPDARIVFTHRNPVDVIGSVCSFVWTLSGMFTDTAQVPELIGDEQADSWNTLFGICMRDREQLPQFEEQIFDIYFEDIKSDPFGTVLGIYSKFGIQPPADMQQRMQAYLDENPRGKHGKHEYTLADYHLTEEGERQRFAAYIEKYGL